MRERLKNSILKVIYNNSSRKATKRLSNKFNAERTPSGNRLVYIDSEEVMETIQDLVYSSLYDVKEKFYKTKVRVVMRFDKNEPKVQCVKELDNTNQ